MLLRDLPADPERKRKEIVPLVLSMLGDRTWKVRWRAAYELYE